MREPYVLVVVVGVEILAVEQLGAVDPVHEDLFAAGKRCGADVDSILVATE